MWHGMELKNAQYMLHYFVMRDAELSFRPKKEDEDSFGHLFGHKNSPDDDWMTFKSSTTLEDTWGYQSTVRPQSLPSVRGQWQRLCDIPGEAISSRERSGEHGGNCWVKLVAQ